MKDGAPLDQEKLSGVDAAGIRYTYDRWPEIAAEAYGDGPDPLDLRGINHVVFAGMGGSGALGDLFGAVLSRMDMHVSIVKGYNLPKTADSETLVVCSSVSGNTAETLTVLDKAANAPCRVVAFSAGGLMQEYCSKRGIPHYHTAVHHSPRASFAAFLYAMMNVLGDGVNVSKGDIRDSIAELRRLRGTIGSDNLAGSNPALSLASWLEDIPMIYYPWGFKAAATRFKNSLQENAKTHAMMEDVLEASHNGMVAWEAPSPVQPVLLQGPDDNHKTKERWRIFEEYFGANSVQYRVVRASEGHIMTKLVSLVYLLDYCSIYMAALRGVDPTPVGSIDFIKERAGYGPP